MTKVFAKLVSGNASESQRLERAARRTIHVRVTVSRSYLSSPGRRISLATNRYSFIQLAMLEWDRQVGFAHFDQRLCPPNHPSSPQSS